MTQNIISLTLKAGTDLIPKFRTHNIKLQDISMIDHISIKVADLTKSKLFYEKSFVPLGYKVSFGEDGIFHAFDIGNGCLFEIVQHNSNEVITSTHIAFRVENQESVQAFHSAAIHAGATDNGKPGPRPNYTKNYYACFILDPDGHNIEAMFDFALKGLR